MSDDPTRMRNQPALMTSSGLRWLVIGAVFAAIAIAVLVPMTEMPPAGVATGAIVAIVIFYLGMLVARATVPHGPLRLRIMAIALIGIALVSLLAVVVVATAAVPT